MTQLAEETSTHMSNFSRLEQESSLPAHPWLERLRKSAIARFESTGFPTTSEEEWRHTNVSAIAKIPFRLARPIEGEIGHRFSMPKAIELVFINGHFAPHLSRHATIDSNTNPFIALNTGFIRDGALVHIPRGVMVESLIFLQFVST